MARKKKVEDEDLRELRLKFEKVAENLETVDAEEFLKKNFLPYAWSYNLDRALVDVSGLKPVQKRILYSMYMDGLLPTKDAASLATAAGSVAHYHPHGESSIVDALKNMGREHIFRVPLVEGTGDYGVPGKPGAAGRYLKTRLTKAAWLNLQEIPEHAVTMGRNYDSTKDEPVKLPVRWPVALINGGSGIAIAYASNMPSHNPTEVMQAARALLQDPSLETKDLMKIVKGPDFNMGGTITTTDGLEEYLSTGRGTFKIRGNYEIKPKARNSVRFEFYELPFGMYPEKIIEQIKAQGEKGDKFQDVASYKNLSDLKHPIRLVIETKPNTNHKKTLQELFNYTGLESSFAANITTIVDSRPQQSSLKALLLDFIEFRKTCVRRKTVHSLEKKAQRLHLLDGLMRVLLDVDKAIAIIRSSDDSEAARTALMSTFSLDEGQANHVLGLQLRRLTKLDSQELQGEKEETEQAVTYMQALLSDPQLLMKHLDEEFAETEKVIGDERRTDILGFTEEEFAAQEKAATKDAKLEERNLPCFITRFADGSLLRGEKAFAYPAESKKLAHGPVMETVKVKSQESIIVLTSAGRGFRIPATYVRLDEATAPKDLGLTLADGERLVGVAKGDPLKTDQGLLMGTKLGEVKLLKANAFPAKEEFEVFKVGEGDEVLDARYASRTLKGAFVVSITRAGYVLAYPAEGLRASGAASGGVRGQKVAEGDQVIAFTLVSSLKDAVLFALSTTGQSIKLTSLGEIPAKGRGAQGVILHRFLRGEDHLEQAYVGPHPVMMLEGSLKKAVAPPAVSRRAASGVPFTLPVVMGSLSATAE